MSSFWMLSSLIAIKRRVVQVKNWQYGWPFWGVVELFVMSQWRMLLMMGESRKGYFVGDVVIEVGTLVVILLFDSYDDWIGQEKKEVMEPSIRYMMTRRRLGHRKQR